MWAFGFLACRWGWDNRSYIEQTLHEFRDGGFPLDAFISDYVRDLDWFPPQALRVRSPGVWAPAVRQLASMIIWRTSNGRQITSIISIII